MTRHLGYDLELKVGRGCWACWKLFWEGALQMVR